MNLDVLATPLHREIDLSGKRRVIAFGDVHGSIEALRRALDEVCFDAAAGDHLIGLGDWLDRGPDVLEVLDFIEEHQGHLDYVRGNHEMLLWNAAEKHRATTAADLIRNGGIWAMTEPHYDEERSNNYSLRLKGRAAKLRLVINAAPVALTVTTPDGRRVGFVHADGPRRSWASFTQKLERETAYGRDKQSGVEWDALWSREAFDAVKRAINKGDLHKVDVTVNDIDHVIHGHSITRQILHHCNRSWIDTGAYKTGILTAIDVDLMIAEGSRGS